MATPRKPGRKVTPESAAKRARAAALRAEGLSWSDTMAGAGYESVGAVRAAVQRHWIDHPEQSPQELRKTMLAELDSMELVLDKLEQGKYVKVTPAGVPAAWVDDDGVSHTIIDVGPVLDVIKLRLMVQKRRSELVGADAPRRTAADVQITAPDLPKHLLGLVDPDAGG